MSTAAPSTAVPSTAVPSTAVGAPRILEADLGVPCVRAFTTLRHGGVSQAPFAAWNLGAHVGDDPAAVTENRRRLQCFLPTNQSPHWLSQVHGTTVVRAGAYDVGHDSEVARTLPEADAIWTNTEGVVCAVMTADCLPVVIAAQDGSAVAVAHAGWRGLAAGVLQQTLGELPVTANSCKAWLGPAIGPSAFEVGEEVRQTFMGVIGDAAAPHFQPVAGEAKWYGDLYGLARLMLSAAGVLQIRGGEHCTFSQSQDFFSYRRDGQTGRMATIAYIDHST